ncbi:MAG TPA: hypothetical protein VGR08_10490 [Thermomicrobiales bacterium]|nr:hypothetical protein [Thermomicrobiales bacterium]
MKQQIIGCVSRVEVQQDDRRIERADVRLGPDIQPEQAPIVVLTSPVEPVDRGQIVGQDKRRGVRKSTPRVFHGRLSLRFFISASSSSVVSGSLLIAASDA